MRRKPVVTPATCSAGGTTYTSQDPGKGYAAVSSMELPLEPHVKLHVRRQIKMEPGVATPARRPDSRTAEDLENLRGQLGWLLEHGLIEPSHAPLAALLRIDKLMGHWHGAPVYRKRGLRRGHHPDDCHLHLPLGPLLRRRGQAHV
jgi:hypothetical protein